jgi:hypothetical protein
MVSLLGAVPAVHAAPRTITIPTSITTSNGSMVCFGSFGGTWGGDTCTVMGTLTFETTIDIGSGVTLAVSSVNPSIVNAGTINNDGTMTGTSGSDGISNSGTINNAGTMTGTSSGTVGILAFSGTINNDGTMTGSGPTYGIYNGGTINDFCGVTVTVDSGNAPNAISCYPVTFDQSGIPTSGVNWGVTASWGPFVLPVDHTGTGGSIAISARGSLTYSYDSPVAGSGVTYVCRSGCSATLTVPGGATFTGTYAILLPPAPPTGAEICQGQASGQCYTSFIAFNVTSGGKIVNANVTIVRNYGPTQIGTTEVGNPLQPAWYDITIHDTVSYTVSLPDGNTVSGTVSNPVPWTVEVVNVSG